MVAIAVNENGKVLTISPKGPKGASLRFHAFWLRDNAQDSETRDPYNGQRLITLKDVASNTRISRAILTRNSVEITFIPENKTICYDTNWLLSNAYDVTRCREKGWVKSSIETWDGAFNLPASNFKAVTENQSILHRWLGKLARYGVAKLTNGPIEEGSLTKIVDLFGYVRETNYGRYFEVQTEVKPSNLAYSGLALQAHTDNPYRDPLPSVQVLYCLESSLTGGESIVIDGFRAAEILREKNKEWFNLLSSYCARFEFSGNSGVCLRARRPIIELAPDGELVAVRFNNRSTAPIVDVPFEKMEAYYSAYRYFSEIIEDPSMSIHFNLEPGDSFVLDNTRVLHARTAYTDLGRRWLQGCYADKDSLLSKLSTLSNRSRGHTEC